MRDDKENIIVDLTFQFSLELIEYVELLEANRKFIIANQLLRSGTSVGANVREAQNAESKADFIHKIKIALKEAEETEYWLLLAKHSKQYPTEENLLLKIASILKILSKIIGSLKRNNT
ncbi:MAG: four helix bundle protein [Bacteroidia bacterium]